MRTRAALLVFALIATWWVAAEEPSPRNENHCGLNDPKLAVCVLAADFYIEHKAWPLTRSALEAHYVKFAAREGVANELKPEDFFRRFSLLELQQKQATLVIRLRENTEQSVTVIILKPGTTLEDIVRSASSESGKRG